MFIRPIPDEESAKKISEGKRKANWIANSGWYTKGGIQWEDGQLSVVDADGEAHPVALPPNGVLLRLTIVEVENGARFELVELYVADENKHLVARLPDLDLETQAAEFKALAPAAGLQYREAQAYPGSDLWPKGGYIKTDGMLDLHKVYKSTKPHHLLGGFFHHDESGA